MALQESINDREKNKFRDSGSNLSKVAATIEQDSALAIPVKITGQDSEGNQTYPIGSTVNNELKTNDDYGNKEIKQQNLMLHEIIRQLRIMNNLLSKITDTDIEDMCD